MSSAEIPDECAACGKAAEGLKKCVACKMVRYCNRECQAAHRSVHKQACREKAAELHDQALFAQPPPRAECPICFLILPLDSGHYQPCCGQAVCGGCYYTVTFAVGDHKCPFCREPTPKTAEKAIEQYNRRMELNDAGAMKTMGTNYFYGQLGLARDPAKARELWEKAGKLGDSQAYVDLGEMYALGEGVARDPKKAKHYWELGAMGGDAVSRFNLGCLEVESNNQVRALKHFMMAAKVGHDRAMKEVTRMRHLITDEEYKEALRAFVKVTREMKSERREKAEELMKFLLTESADSEKWKRIQEWMKANGQL